MQIQKDYLQKRFCDAKTTYAKNATIQYAMQETLWSLLQKHKQGNLKKVLELGIGNGNLSQKIIKHYKPTHYIGIDFVDFSLKNVEFIQADFETIEHIEALRGEKFELIVSNAALQWSNQRILLPQLSTFLEQKGILLFSTFGKDNFKELRTLFNVGLDYLSLHDYGQILSDLDCKESFMQTTALHFESPLAVFKHLKHTGVNALKQNFTLTKAHLNAYATQFKNCLTYNMLFLLAQKP